MFNRSNTVSYLIWPKKSQSYSALSYPMCYMCIFKFILHILNHKVLYCSSHYYIFNILYPIQYCSYDVIIERACDAIRLNYLFTLRRGHHVQNGTCDDDRFFLHFDVVISCKMLDEHSTCLKTE